MKASENPVSLHIFVSVCISIRIDTIIIIIITSSGDLQPSTAIANQLPGQLVYTQITTRGPNCFKFIIPLIMPSRNIV